MYPIDVRAAARWLCVSLLIAAVPSHAESTAQLQLDEAELLALQHQPLLDAQRAAIRGAQALAIADRELPDPKLTTGLKDYPINGDPAFSVDKDDFTMLTLGVSQEFTRAGKRRLRGEHAAIEARTGEFELAALEREIRRDVALGWLELYRAQQALEPAQRLVREFETALAAQEIALRNGQAQQAELLAARVELGLARDRVRALQRDQQRSRAALSRYLGADAERALPPTLPALPEPPPLAEVLERLRAHPHLDRYAEQVHLAENEVEQARQDYRPDWSMSLEYGYRQRFPDFVGVQVEMDLPVFGARRQDRRLEARLAGAEQIRLQRDDVLRQHEAEARGVYADWQTANERLHAFDQEILPAARNRVEATRLAYGAAHGTLAEVLSARRALLDTELMQLEQRVDTARALAQLRYFAD